MGFSSYLSEFQAISLSKVGALSSVEDRFSFLHERSRRFLGVFATGQFVGHVLLEAVAVA